MSNKTNKFTHLGVFKPTQRKVAILSAVKGKDISILVGELVEAAWDDAKRQGLVNDAMVPDGAPVAEMPA